MRRVLGLVIVALLVLCARHSRADNVQLGLRLPPGFEVHEFADSALANDVFCLTLDPRGRVVVSGRGYVRILADDDGDGRADRALDFADGPKDGAQGLLWEGTSLFVSGDGGLRRYHDRDGDDRADGPAELIRALKTGGEHDTHALRRGPDGWLYLLCGNFAGVTRDFAGAASPVREPVAGCVLRLSPDLKTCEVVADGFRNPYGMDFNPDGELFTYDSDNERCVSLPWYEPTRFYHVIPGGRHGWQAPQFGQFWRQPPYFPDVVAPVATLGRGSPTGVVCYRHTQFPEQYRGALFLMDWTFGKVYAVALSRSGSTYTGRPEVFLESVGENGFAPTAGAVDPATGDLYVAIGGRGTRGAVYRIRYSPGVRAARGPLPVRPRSLDWRSELLQELPRQARGEDALARRRALELLLRHRSHFDGRQLRDAVRASWGDPDRSLRNAAAALIASMDPGYRQVLVQDVKTPLELATFAFGTAATEPQAVAGHGQRLLDDAAAPVEARLAGVRLLQIALGDVMSSRARGTIWEGYTSRREVDPEMARAVGAVLRQAWPTGSADLDREVLRTLAMLEDDAPGLPERVAGRLTPTSDPVEDIHTLTVLARLRGPRTPAMTARTAGALLGLDHKFTERKLYRDRHWPLRVAELHEGLTRRDPRLNESLLAHAEFGRPDHALFARAPGFDRKRAAEVFLARSAADPDFAWNASLIDLLGSLPEERSLPVLRRLWGQAGLDEAILPLLARQPRPEDRDRFLEGLTSPQPATVRLSLTALEQLPPVQEPAAVLVLVKALRALPDGKDEEPLRRRLTRLLARATGQDQVPATRDGWTDWFTRTHPDLAPRLGGDDGVDVAGWRKRLAALDWSAGDAERGQKVYVKASCASCHSGAQALGPDLRGVAGRFSRDDLFTAVVQPSKDISPRYRTTAVETADGKVYQGMVIYEAVDSMILQTGPAATTRLAHAQVVGRRTTDRSLMPAGLLDKLSDREIADLYEYLKGLSGPAALGSR